jgi:hypothetical protein
MSDKDPFAQIGSIDKLRSGSGISQSDYSGQIAGSEAASRAGQGAGATAVAPSQQDSFQASEELRETQETRGTEAAGSAAAAGGVNFSAWAQSVQPTEQVQGIKEASDAQKPGIQAGGIYGADGKISGVQPGIQPGGIYTSGGQQNKDL